MQAPEGATNAHQLPTLPSSEYRALPCPANEKAAARKGQGIAQSQSPDSVLAFIRGGVPAFVCLFLSREKGYIIMPPTEK